MPAPSRPPSPPPASRPVVTQTFGILVALAILSSVAFLALYFKSEQDAEQARMNAATLSAQLTRLEEQLITPTKTPTASGSEGTSKMKAWLMHDSWDLKFNYPQGWSVATFEDEFVEGQTNLRLTSSPGELRLGGGPGTAGVLYFYEGVQIEIKKFAAGQASEKLVATDYPNIQKVDEECEEVGCPTALYVFTGSQNKYWITIYTNPEPDQNVSSIITMFLASLSDEGKIVNQEFGPGSTVILKQNESVNILATHGEKPAAGYDTIGMLKLKSIDDVKNAVRIAVTEKASGETVDFILDTTHNQCTNESETWAISLEALNSQMATFTMGLACP